ncbi:MAG: 5-(carboxyamino)imidazole ribonucleotide mutase [Actinomycetota bacterium]|nr:5-(carboxyamino)imidazole ribonucleotide mutase [Actinomycetota bacterium]
MSDVVIAMGSDSDLPVMSTARDVLTELAVNSELRILSAHRTPFEMLSFAKEARGNGVKVIIAGAGGAAHLPGMIAAATTLPVIGVPVSLKHLDGLDSLLAIVQMPRGIPVATVAIDNATNAALLAARILSVNDSVIASKLEKYQDKNRQISLEKDAALLDQQNRGHQ